MFEEFRQHNLFWKDIKTFIVQDPHLSQLEEMKYVHPLDWWLGLDWGSPGIYILTGGRQIGKSTSTKLMIKNSLEESKFSAGNIFYLPCDTIDEHQQLLKIIRAFLDQQKDGERFLIVIDEVTFVKGWERSIKALADEGVFRNGFCILTGSDSVILKDAAKSFPGRRGSANKTDFHLHPLTFLEYIKLVNPPLLRNVENQTEEIFLEFDRYWKCGGFLRAINDLSLNQQIREATYDTFEQWIIGDFNKRGKTQRTLEDILSAILKTSTSQISYSSLSSKATDISKDTLIEYCDLLKRMDILLESEAFDQNTRRGFPKKARKFYFSDPFIIDVIERWLTRERYVQHGIGENIKAESIAVSNFKRTHPTYYIKAEGEVDIVIVTEKGFTPIEVKWTNQLRSKDLKQLAKYKNGFILSKQKESSIIEGIPSHPLPIHMLK